MGSAKSKPKFTENYCKSTKRCSCGYKIRGMNHEAGKHHKMGRNHK